MTTTSEGKQPATSTQASEQGAEVSFDVWQGGMIVASVSAPDADRAFAEIMHYAMVYAQDGPVQVKPAGAPPPEWSPPIDLKKLWEGT